MQKNYVSLYDNIPEFIYHGSYTAVRQPEIRIDLDRKKDFGYGFYCTRLYDQAAIWASHMSPSWVTTYRITSKIISELKVCIFRDTNEKWFRFVIHCRRGGSHLYDIVIGPMADDKMNTYLDQYLQGEISEELFIELCRFNYPTHQMAFCTEKSLNAIKYMNAERIYL